MNDATRVQVCHGCGNREHLLNHLYKRANGLYGMDAGWGVIRLLYRPDTHTVHYLREKMPGFDLREILQSGGVDVLQKVGGRVLEDDADVGARVKDVQDLANTLMCSRLQHWHDITKRSGAGLLSDDHIMYAYRRHVRPNRA